MLREWYKSKRLAVEKQIAYLHKLRLRAFAIVLGLGLATLGLLSMSILPTLPVVVGAFAVAALVVNKVAAQLSNPVCIGCGEKLDNEPLGQYGVICPKCGTISASAKSDKLEIAVLPEDELIDDEEHA